MAGYVIGPNGESRRILAGYNLKDVGENQSVYFQGFLEYKDPSGKRYRTLFSENFDVGLPLDGFHITWPDGKDPARYNDTYEMKDEASKAVPV